MQEDEHKKSLVKVTEAKDFVQSSFQVVIGRVQQIALQKACAKVPCPEEQLALMASKRVKKREKSSILSSKNIAKTMDVGQTIAPKFHACSYNYICQPFDPHPSKELRAHSGHRSWAGRMEDRSSQATDRQTEGTHIQSVPRSSRCEILLHGQGSCQWICGWCARWSHHQVEEGQVEI